MRDTSCLYDLGCLMGMDVAWENVYPKVLVDESRILNVPLNLKGSTRGCCL
jgi:hypothetical protein